MTASETEAATHKQQYWDDYYRKTAGSDPVPSQFAVFVLNELDDRSFIADVGCGSGRDAFFFARRGHKVLGVDGSSSATASCSAKAATLDAPISFVTASVSDPDLASTITTARGDMSAAQSMIYARFFIHAITDEEEAGFLRTAHEALRGGGLLAVEFRTLRDAALAKVTPGHYRRFVDPLRFLEAAKTHGFTARYFVEGFGFAKFRNDDAHVARLLLTAA